MAEHTKLVTGSGENARSQFKKVKTTERLYQEVVRQIEERIGRAARPRRLEQLEHRHAE